MALERVRFSELLRLPSLLLVSVAFLALRAPFATGIGGIVLAPELFLRLILPMVLFSATKGN